MSSYRHVSLDAVVTPVRKGLFGAANPEESPSVLALWDTAFYPVQPEVIVGTVITEQYVDILVSVPAFVEPDVVSFPFLRITRRTDQRVIHNRCLSPSVTNIQVCMPWVICA